MKQTTRLYKNDNKYRIVSFVEHFLFECFDFDRYYDVRMLCFVMWLVLLFSLRMIGILMMGMFIRLFDKGLGLLGWLGCLGLLVIGMGLLLGLLLTGLLGIGLLGIGLLCSDLACFGCFDCCCSSLNLLTLILFATFGRLDTFARSATLI